ncbi:hypothetical protein BU26DRAFT_566471 [Trematosphaeria pertusa]|uniref:Uncharacterized protein n=1 Tax=Trematosphaeria pertusa TaxID=390896 RepID=A0A6A6IB82_9PLEO|nr:uncharacterized protein BU26DRAFT_566471 [Trematosphaeria pertusa]KAF2247499.1 hypothetical protein BU26DRAFT_566471 [Trematosphaeria pertusa]
MLSGTTLFEFGSLPKNRTFTVSAEPIYHATIERHGNMLTVAITRHEDPANEVSRSGGSRRPSNSSPVTVWRLEDPLVERRTGAALVQTSTNPRTRRSRPSQLTTAIWITTLVRIASGAEIEQEVRIARTNDFVGSERAKKKAILSNAQEIQERSGRKPTCSRYRDNPATTLRLCCDSDADASLSPKRLPKSTVQTAGKRLPKPPAGKRLPKPPASCQPQSPALPPTSPLQDYGSDWTFEMNGFLYGWVATDWEIARAYNMCFVPESGTA